MALKVLAAPSLISGHASYNAHLPQSRDFAHGLDFNSLRGYNDPEPPNGGGVSVWNLP